ncbi:MAG: cell division protein ZapB [Sphaerochaetaceae bacterium]|nr:cell division protein ZapB [Sphaerochaetaceae bacterium]
MTAYENMLKLEARVQKAVNYINTLREEIDELNRNIKLISGHNQELQSYVDNYKEDEERINKSIALSLESLNDVGLDNMDLVIDDLEVAEQFSAIGGDALDTIDLGDLDL